MYGKQKLIDDILAAAETAAESIIAEANAEIEQALAELEKTLGENKERELEKIRAAADTAYAGQVKLGELEAGKILLRKKQECIAAVYDGVKARLLAASDAEYLKLMQKLIVSACADGDTVIAAKGDKRITAAWVKKVATAAGKKLMLSDERGDFSGGVILSNGNYDRDLTIDEIVDELKERTLADTARALGF